MKIVYKIIAALGALATIPLAIFGKTIYFKAQSLATMVLAWIGQQKGYGDIEEIVANNGGELPQAIGDSYSIYDIASLVKSLSGLSAYSDNSSSSVLEVIVNPALTFATILVLLFVCAVVTAVLAIVCKDNRKVMYSSIAGIGLSMMVKYSFEALAEPFVSQQVSLSTVFDNSLLGLIGELEVLELTSTFWFIPLIFGAVILWTVLYNFTLPEKEKLERKIMLGEAETE